MTYARMLTEIDGAILAEAFPDEYRSAALRAGVAAASLLAPRQWTERFAVQVEDQTVLIPARLHFASGLKLSDDDAGWLFARALQTRSNDGYERQRAARDLIAALPTWAAPFIVALIGEYIVEILEDVTAAMTPELEQTLGGFIVHNAAFWGTTKRRVASYWNVYYRHRTRSNCHRALKHDEYVGFRLIDRLESVVASQRSYASASI